MLCIGCEYFDCVGCEYDKVEDEDTETSDNSKKTRVFFDCDMEEFLEEVSK